MRLVRKPMEVPMSKTRSRFVSLLFSILVIPALSVDGAAQAAHFNYAQLTSNNGFSAPAGIGADASGNIYVADTGNNAVKEVAPGCILASCAVTLGSGFSSPSGDARGAGRRRLRCRYRHPCREGEA